MVQAIDLGTKTKTRRTKGLELINKEPNIYNRNGEPMKYKNRIWDSSIEENPNPLKTLHGFKNSISSEIEYVECPYGKVGDILWVRETFRPIAQEIGPPRFEYKATEKINLTDKWKPSLFMPKEACRIFIQIKSVTVERLIDISESDAIAEGVLFYYDTHLEKNKFFDYISAAYLKTPIKQEFSFFPWDLAVESFYSLWKQINGFDSFYSNPWVWVIEFEKVEKPENFI